MTHAKKYLSPMPSCQVM